uniref:Uncharacterized protein n=1 Tax=Meloidogyne enterolobii TaxID=390850 RepID=A0A6V7U885_MELEN|nr:unnamed protein product [Meloidogyne enterolobii]
MVTKWKQTIRDGNKEKQLKLQQQQHQETKVKAQKPSGVGVAAVSGKNVKRASTESDVGDGPSTSQTSSQLKPRTGSISSPATSHQQQIGSRSNSFNVQNTTGLNKTGESSVSAPPKPERPKTIAKAKAKISRPRLTGMLQLGHDVEKYYIKLYTKLFRLYILFCSIFVVVILPTFDLKNLFLLFNLNILNSIFWCINR